MACKECAHCRAHAQTEWSVLSADGVRRIDSARRSVLYEQGQPVFRQREPSRGIYCLESGLVLLRHFDQFGEPAGIQIVKYGETMGWRSFFAQRPHAATAIALTPCEVCFIPGSFINECIAREPQLAQAFLKTMASDRRPLEALTLRSPQLPVRARLIYLLLYLKDRCANHTRRGTLVYDLPLLRQDVASLIGTRSETLSRTISALEKEQLASFHGRQITIADPGRLFGLIGIRLPLENR
jgi:CRP-like cAMP-binding protein